MMDEVLDALFPNGKIVEIRPVARSIILCFSRTIFHYRESPMIITVVISATLIFELCVMDVPKGKDQNQFSSIVFFAPIENRTTEMARAKLYKR